MERPAWARDHDMKWLLELGAAFLTLRKLVLVNGAYEFALGQARGLGLLKPLTRRAPGLTVDADALERAEAAWEPQVGPPRMPHSWSAVHGDVVYEVPYGDPDEEDWDDPLDAGVRGDVEHNDAVAAGLRSVLGAHDAGGGRCGSAVARLRDPLGGSSSGDDGTDGASAVVGHARLTRRVRRAELPDRPRTLTELLGDEIELPLPEC